MSLPTPVRTTRPTPSNAARQRLLRAWQDGCRHATAGRWRQAREAFRAATQAAPDEALYWINLARTERQLGRADACLAAARTAAALDPSEWLYSHFLIERLQQAHAYAAVLDALEQYRHAEQQAHPGAELPAAWHLACGEALLHLGQPEPALAPAMQALVLTGLDHTDGGVARRNAATLLGHVLAQLKRHAEAALCFRMALDADPQALGAALYAAHYGAWTCDWRERATDLARLQHAFDTARQAPAGTPLADFSPFCLFGLSDDADLQRWAAEHTALQRQLAPQPRPRGAAPRPHGRLRIGLISADFHHHATSILLVQVLEHLERERYELYFYSGGRDDRSALRQRIRATATRIHEVATWSDAQLAAQIRHDQIGVLFDLKGYTANHRLGVLAQRPAPVQVAWLGYPGTSGAAGIDYIIGDPVVTPLAHAADFSEAIAQLPHCYQPNDSLRSRPPLSRRADCGLPEQALVLASFNQAYKTTPEMFGAWCAILQALPDAVLWLLVPEPTTQQRLREAAATHGIAAERLIFADMVGTETHRARLPQADLILDTWPCSGHTTSSDALWAGVPVLTRCGRSFAARVSASLLHTLGLDELICDDLDSYIGRAVALGRDATALAALRHRLAEATNTSPLFDGRRFATDLAALIERMAARQDAGLEPAALPALDADADVHTPAGHDRAPA